MTFYGYSIMALSAAGGVLAAIFLSLIGVIVDEPLYVGAAGVTALCAVALAVLAVLDDFED